MTIPDFDTLIHMDGVKFTDDGVLVLHNGASEKTKKLLKAVVTSINEHGCGVKYRED